jgi:hypothetical protein
MLRQTTALNMTGTPYDGTIGWDRYRRESADPTDDDANGSMEFVVGPLVEFIEEKGTPESYGDVGCGVGTARYASTRRRTASAPSGTLCAPHSPQTFAVRKNPLLARVVGLALGGERTEWRGFWTEDGRLHSVCPQQAARSVMFAVGTKGRKRY